MKDQGSRTLNLNKAVLDKLMRICEESGKSQSEVILEAVMNLVKVL
jgi:hypothetical protein